MKPIDPRTAKTKPRGRLTAFGAHTLGVARAWPPHWEIHPHGEELLHVLEGSVTVELLGKSGRVRRVRVGAGELCVVPRGTWHRPIQKKPVVMLYVTPGAGTRASFAEEPPRARRVKRAR